MIDKKILKENNDLDKACQEARKIDFSKKIKEIKSEIMKKKAERDEHAIFGDSSLGLLNIDLGRLNGNLVSLQTTKQNRITECNVVLNRHTRIHSKPIFQHLNKLNESLERQKIRETSAGGANLFGPLSIIKTNILEILEQQLEISEMFEHFCIVDVITLSEMMEKVENLEARLKSEFKTINLKLTEIQRIDFSMLFQNPDNDVQILSSETIRRYIKLVKTFQNPDHLIVMAA